MTASGYWADVLRILSRNALFMGPLCIAAAGLSGVAGVSSPALELVALGAGGLAANLTRRPAREAILRRVTHRPGMTAADYELTWELERELGWEPSEPCMPVNLSPSAPPKAPDGPLQHVGQRIIIPAKPIAATWNTAISGSGTLTGSARVSRSVPWCQEHMCPADDPACDCPNLRADGEQQ